MELLTQDERDHWLTKVRELQQRRERIRALREQLKAARAHGKALGHANRLRRIRAEQREKEST